MPSQFYFRSWEVLRISEQLVQKQGDAMSTYKRGWLFFFVIYLSGLAFYFIKTPEAISSVEPFLSFDGFSAAVAMIFIALLFSYILNAICAIVGWGNLPAEPLREIPPQIGRAHV